MLATMGYVRGVFSYRHNSWLVAAAAAITTGGTPTLLYQKRRGFLSCIRLLTCDVYACVCRTCQNMVSYVSVLVSKTTELSNNRITYGNYQA